MKIIKMFSLYTLVLSGMLLMTGCAGKITTGQRVFIAPHDSVHLNNCELVGYVTVGTEMLIVWDRNELAKELKNRLRDAAANQFPKGDTVTYSEMTDTGVMGTVFRCLK